MANITFSDKQLFMQVFFFNLLCFGQTCHPRPGPVFSMEGHQDLKSAKRQGLKLGTNQRHVK